MKIRDGIKLGVGMVIGKALVWGFVDLIQDMEKESKARKQQTEAKGETIDNDKTEEPVKDRKVVMGFHA